VGRKNWRFAGSRDVAKASANFFSRIETAKAKGLEPYAYLRSILKKLPVTQTEHCFSCCHEISISIPLPLATKTEG
jgi:hypothetical protein